METKGSILRFSISLALSNVKIHIGRQFFPLGLPEHMREEVARNAIKEMRKYAQWNELDDEIKPYSTWSTR